jgi:hypothetical protein
MQSVKTGLEIRLESAGELAIAKLLDLDPRSRDLNAQGQTFDLANGEIYAALPNSKVVDSRYYTYDLSNRVGEIRYIYEVKPQRFCQRHEALFSAVEAFCRAKGMRFVVLTREEFGDRLLKNIEVLHQFYRQSSSYLANLAETVDALSTKQGHVRQVLKSLEPTNHYLIAALLYGVLKIDLFSSSILSMDFNVVPAHGELSMFQVLNYA